MGGEEICAGVCSAPEEYAFPLRFASRLNSMADRADLWDGPEGLLGWIARQGQVQLDNDKIINSESKVKTNIN